MTTASKKKITKAASTTPDAAKQPERSVILSPEERNTPAGKGMMKLAQSGERTRSSIENILVDKDENIRMDDSYTDEDLDQLAEQIRSFGGLMKNLICCRINPTPENGMKTLMVIDGHRRCLAIQRLCESDPSFGENLPVCIIPVHSKGEVRLLQMAMNISKHVSPMEKAIAIQEALNDPKAIQAGLTQRMLAANLGMSEPSLSQHLALLRFPEKLRKLVNSGEISMSNARTMLAHVPESKWEDMAPIACKEDRDVFEANMKRSFGGPSTKEEGDIPGEKKEAQRGRTLVPATKIATAYIPFLEAQVKNASETDNEKKYSLADLWRMSLDTIKTIQMDNTTQLAKAIEPFLAAQASAEEANKEKENASKAEKKFWKDQVKVIKEILKAPVDINDPAAVRPTLAMATAQVARKIADEFKAGKITKASVGFDIKGDDIEGSLKNLFTAFKIDAEEAKKRLEAKAKADAEAKAKAEAEAAKAAPASDPSVEVVS